MTTQADRNSFFSVRVCDLSKRDLRDVMNDAIASKNSRPETARRIHALRHTVELILWAAEAILDEEHNGCIAPPEQLLSWASAKLCEVRDGEKVLTPATPKLRFIGDGHTS